MPPSLEMNVKTPGSLDLSGKLPPVMLEEPVHGSRAWAATDLVSEDWTIYRHSGNCSGDDADGEIRIPTGTLSNPMCSFGRYDRNGLCRLPIIGTNNISKEIKSSKPDFLYTEREFWEFYPERDLN